MYHTQFTAEHCLKHIYKNRMKIQLIILVVCVVAICALPERSNDEETQNARLQNYREERMELQNDNQESADGDQLMDNNLVENSISANGTTTEKNKSNCARRQRNENRRRWSNHGEEWRRRNITDSNHRGCRHRLSHVYDSLKIRDENQIHVENSEIERHHQQHHHKTTTTIPTTTPSTPSSAFEE